MMSDDLRADCLLAAECLAETNTFETGQAILKEAAYRIEELEAKLAKAVEALEGVREFVRDLCRYADQGHTLVPALKKACTILAELKGHEDAVLHGD